MGSVSQGIRSLRTLGGALLRIALGATVVVGATAVAWKLITLPPPRPKPKPPVERSGPGYFTVAAAAVDVEVAAPDGRRTSTAAHADSAARIPDSEAAVDCGGFGRMRESNEACSASVMIRNPAFGAYRVIATATDSTRFETLTVGYGGSTFRRSGAFTVRLRVEPRHPVEFSVSVSPEGVSQRSKPQETPR